MNLKVFRIMILAISCFLSVGLFAQVKVYKTYSDYLNKISEDFSDADYSKSNLIFGSSDNKTKYKYDEIWGFSYDNTLFRSYNSDLYKVLRIGKISSYSTGKTALMLLKKKSVFYHNPSDAFIWSVSDSLNHDIYWTPFNPMNSKGGGKFKKQFRKFQSDYPEHKQFYECVEGTQDLQKFNTCLGRYDG